MSIGGFFSSESSATDKRIGATDNATVTQGSGTSGRDNAVVVGKGANLNVGGLDLSRAKVGGDLILGDGGAQTAAFATSALDTILGINKTNLDATKDLVSSQNLAFGAALEKQGSLGQTLIETIQGALTQVRDLAESKQTDGISGLSKIFLTLALASIGLGAIYLFRKK